MNEQIQELAEQCTEVLWRDGPYEREEFDKEKFALLIVQANIQTLRSHGYDDAAQVLQDIHFGIEDPV
jgi:hypothetical protein